MTPDDLFCVETKTLGLKTIRPHRPGLWTAFWEWRKGQRLICASVTETERFITCFVSMSHGDSASKSELSNDEVAWLRGILNAELEWKQATGHVFHAMKMVAGGEEAGDAVAPDVRLAEPRAEIILHTEPSAVPDEHLALLTVLLTQAFDLGKSMGVQFPIHVMVDIGGRQACGIVAPEGMLAAGEADRSHTN